MLSELLAETLLILVEVPHASLRGAGSPQEAFGFRCVGHGVFVRSSPLPAIQAKSAAAPHFADGVVGHTSRRWDA